MENTDERFWSRLMVTVTLCALLVTVIYPVYHKASEMRQRALASGAKKSKPMPAWEIALRFFNEGELPFGLDEKSHQR